MTVTWLSPCLVWRQTCSSTSSVVTPSSRAGSSISSRRLSVNTASLAVCQATPGRDALDPDYTAPAKSPSMARLPMQLSELNGRCAGR